MYPTPKQIFANYANICLASGIVPRTSCLPSGHPTGGSHNYFFKSFKLYVKLISIIVIFQIFIFSIFVHCQGSTTFYLIKLNSFLFLKSKMIFILLLKVIKHYRRLERQVEVEKEERMALQRSHQEISTVASERGTAEARSAKAEAERAMAERDAVRRDFTRLL